MDQVANAVATYESIDTKALRQQLRQRVEQFEAEGGRGVELADEIDSLRIALAARSVFPGKRNR